MISALLALPNTIKYGFFALLFVASLIGGYFVYSSIRESAVNEFRTTQMHSIIQEKEDRIESLQKQVEFLAREQSRVSEQNTSLRGRARTEITNVQQSEDALNSAIEGIRRMRQQ